MQNNDKLCPFCGSEPVENKEHYIPNNLCCPHGHTTPMIRNEWNTRRHAEKLVPIDKYEMIAFLTDVSGIGNVYKYFDDGTKMMIAEQFCARFASVSVVPEVDRIAIREAQYDYFIGRISRNDIDHIITYMLECMNAAMKEGNDGK